MPWFEGEPQDQRQCGALGELRRWRWPSVVWREGGWWPCEGPCLQAEQEQGVEQWEPGMRPEWWLLCVDV